MRFLRRFRPALVVAMLLAGACGPAPVAETDEVVDLFGAALSEAALERTNHRVTYDPAYRRIGYPGGDVPSDRGVCTDLVVRAYRALGLDLQRLVHEDMVKAFSEYPTRWGLTAPDPNIDHRRVPNLEVFFTRHGEVLPISDRAEDYRPGALVTWDVDGRPHIGIVVDRLSEDGERHLVVHNIGRGPRLEDVLFAYPVTGHYRYVVPGAVATPTAIPAATP
jgi:uncharacterized protein YijF (DUF1287 family)